LKKSTFLLYSFNGEHVRDSPWVIPLVGGSTFASGTAFEGRKREEEMMAGGTGDDKEDM
jgi:hypothetical protein